MWLVPSHLTLCFLNLLGDCVELFLERCFLCVHLRSLLLEYVHYLEINFVTDQFHALCLGLCYMCLSFLSLCQDLCYLLLQWFHLILILFFLCLLNGEFFPQFLHVLHPFDAFYDGNCLLPLLEVLDSCIDALFFLVPHLDLLILL
jgi:hypothetical protein